MPKILIVAPNASSLFGGEAFLPLNYYKILHRRGFKVQLIAHARNRNDLETFLGPAIKDVYFVEDTIWHRGIWAIGRKFPKRFRDVIIDPLFNWINERFQARIIRQLVAAGEVDLVHQPIPVSPLTPSAIHGFGVPVIIGPMNGGMTYPEGYENLESPNARRLITGARAIARQMNWFVDGKAKAAVLLVANERTRAALPCPKHANILSLVENGVDFDTWSRPEKRKTVPGFDGSFRFVFMGRLVGLKALDITLEAFAQARTRGVNATLEVLGDGPERRSLEQRAAQDDLAGSISFAGFLPQAECAHRLAVADALILNSVRECGGAVVLEAMAMGLPVVASDWGGPADYLDTTCGILVSPIPRETFANRLATAIEKLANNRDLCQRMGVAGMEKARTRYDWEKKVDRIIEIYEDTFKKANYPDSKTS